MTGQPDRIPSLNPSEINALAVPLRALYRDFPIPSFPVATWSVEAERHTRSWTRRMGLIRSPEAASHFAAINVGQLAGRVYPDAAAHHGNLVTDWFSWLFLFDDQCDEGRIGRDPVLLHAATNDIKNVFDGSSRPLANPLARAMADLYDRLLPLATSPWLERFCRHVREYLDGCVWEAANRATSLVPTPEEYPAARRAAGAIIPAFDLIEFSTRTYLVDAIYDLTTYQEALHAAADVVCWTDDLATVAKEYARGDVHNLVIVLAHHRKISWTDAVREAGRLLTERINDFLHAERTLLTTAPITPLVANLVGLRQWMRGHLDWGIETARYREVEHTAEVPGYVDDLC